MTDRGRDPFDALRRRPGRTEPRPEFTAAVMDLVRDAIAAEDRRRTDVTQEVVLHVVPDVLPDPVPDIMGEPPVEAPAVVFDAARTPPRARRHSVVVIAAAVAAAIAAVLVSAQAPVPTSDRVEATASSSAGPGLATSEPMSGLPASQPMELLGGERLAVSGQPAAVDVAGGDLLVGYESHQVELIDPASGAVRSSFQLRAEGGYGAAAEAFGSLWLPSVGMQNKHGTLYRIDLATGSVEGIDLPLGLVYSSAASADEDGIWVLADTLPRTLEHVDAATNRVDASLPVPDLTMQFQFGLGSLWAAGPGRLSRLDPTDGKVLGTVELSTEAVQLARVDGDEVWVVGVDRSSSSLQLHRVDAASLTVEATVALTPASAFDPWYYPALAVTDDAVWVVTPDALLTRVDKASNAVVARYGGQGGGDVVVGDGALWVAATASKAVYRIPL